MKLVNTGIPKKLGRFYRIARWAIIILFASNILTKTIIWVAFSGAKDVAKKYTSFIAIFPNTPRFKHKYTTELKQELFNRVDYLLTPAFAMLFVVLTVKLVNAPELFKERH